MIYRPAPAGRGPSPHFTWAEVIGNGKSGYPAVPLGPFRLPNGHWVRPRVSARKQAYRMELLRDGLNRLRAQHHEPETGIVVLSWARSWQHNKDVGGAANSQHLYFDACDIALSEIDRLCPWQGGRASFDLVANLVFARGGFGQYPAGSRHVDSRGYRARWTSWLPARRR
jgi:hypothetical protein